MKENQIIRYKGKLGRVIKDNDKKDRFLPVNYGTYYPDRLDLIKSTNLKLGTIADKLEYIKKEFVWGVVIGIHCIGDFQIIESREKETTDVTFHPYIDFKSISVGYNNLDTALIGVIAHKYEGSNSQAGNYFCKMLGLKE